MGSGDFETSEQRSSHKTIKQISDSNENSKKDFIS